MNAESTAQQAGTAAIMIAFQRGVGPRVRFVRATLLISVCGIVLAGCGGGGARPEPLSPPPTNMAPTPAPTQTPPPSPTPTPSSSTGYDDLEYLISTGAAAAHAATAYEAGATGKGVKIGIVDSGLDPSLSEFAGRIDPASRDVRSGGPLIATGSHGSAVTAVAAAARNGSGIQGVAFDSTIVAFNTANPNDCEDGTCHHENKDIAKGIDLARAAGAKVINISLGGSAPGDTLIAAVQRATQAGIVVVFAGGNDGGANPDALGLQSAQQGGNGLVILAGALDANGNIASFSNRAGVGANYYLMALGDQVQTIDQNGVTGMRAGSSFAAPVISGAVALIASAFPNMSGAQIIDLLFRTADDLGAPGVDSIYGHGALDLQRAFQPQGTVSLAGSSAPITLSEGNQASPAMGDAVSGELSYGAVILDGYSRAFAVDFQARLAHAAQDRPLAQALAGNTRIAGSARGPVAVSLTVARDFMGQPEVGLAQTGLSYEDARKARALAGFALGQVTPRTAIAFGFSETGAALQQRLAGHSDDAFLVARNPMTRNGFVTGGGTAVAVRQQLGRWGLTVSGETGQVWNDYDPQSFDRAGYNLASVTADRWVGPAHLSIGASRLQEERTVLGGRFSSAFTSGGATSWFLDGEARFDLGDGWGAAARYRRGWTNIANSGGLVSRGRLGTDAWSLDLARSSAFAAGDRLALRVTQPLRVASGGFALNIPVSYDYSDGSIGYEARFMNLAPTGRELDFEAAYGIALGRSYLSLNSYLRRQPGHIATADDDLGTAVRWSLAF